MAPTVIHGDELIKRAGVCPTGTYLSNGRCYENSNWYFWGRWVLTAVLIIFFIALIAFFSNRRRRRNGMQPYYGTGWMPGTGPNKNQNNPNGYNNAPPPVYTPAPGPGHQQVPQYTGQTFSPNDGYYGNGQQGQQAEGIQLQQPAHSYQRGTGGDNVYEPPAGPPPPKA